MEMKQGLRLTAMLALVALAVGPAAWAQGGMKGKGGGGWGPGSQFGRMYDPKTVETVTGEVIKVERVAPMRGMSAGVHLVVKTDKGDVSVHLGPQWYLENQEIQIAAHDKVAIKGSRVTLGGKPAIIAGEVQKGGDTLKLRDDAGVPVWSGWRRG
jgi:hypothetical protein